MNRSGRENNPLYNDNRLKLGVFGLTVSGGVAISTDERALKLTWPNTLAIGQQADAIGIEALVPPGRWRGFGGVTNFNSESFETYTAAAGLAQGTSNSAVFATTHVPIVHPVLAAKQSATVDHISGGRFAINLVCGWYDDEVGMFGQNLREHDERYDWAAEWVELVRMLWSRGEDFDFEGKYYSVKKGFSMPKPLQRPFPPIMNAGGSEKGRQFAAKYADIAFVTLTSHDSGDFDQTRRQIDAYRELARSEHGREIGIWCSTYVVQGETEQDAQDYLRSYAVDRGDDAAVASWMKHLGIETRSVPLEVRDKFTLHFKAGAGSFPLVGTAEQIASKLQALSSAGVDGILLNWLEYVPGLQQWGATMMPLLEQMELRRPLGNSRRQ